MTDDTAPHLRQIPVAIAEALCARVGALEGLLYVVKREALPFAQSRTPHDATRLANALHHSRKGDPAVDALVRDLDAAAEACAGCPLPNKHSRSE